MPNPSAPFCCCCRDCLMNTSKVISTRRKKKNGAMKSTQCQTRFWTCHAPPPPAALTNCTAVTVKVKQSKETSCCRRVYKGKWPEWKWSRRRGEQEHHNWIVTSWGSCQWLIDLQKAWFVYSNCECCGGGMLLLVEVQPMLLLLLLLPFPLSTDGNRRKRHLCKCQVV